MSITYEPINVVDQLNRKTDSYLRVLKEDVPYGQLRVRHPEGEGIVEVQYGLHVTSVEWSRQELIEFYLPE